MTIQTIKIELEFDIDLYDADLIQQETIDRMLVAVKEEREHLVTEARIYLVQGLSPSWDVSDE